MTQQGEKSERLSNFIATCFLFSAACFAGAFLIEKSSAESLEREIRRLRVDSAHLHKIIIKQNSMSDACTWCKAVEDYSLNINCKHYEESGDN